MNKLQEQMKKTILLLAAVMAGTALKAQDPPRSIKELPALGCTLADSALLKKVVKKCKFSKNRGKTVAVFGGSLSVNKESQAAKIMWKEYLDMQVTDYGCGGFGFSKLQGSIIDQVKRAGKHDIYILWASTNDYTNNREPGTANDFTEADGFNSDKLTTQCGGLNFCIHYLRGLNPKAKIYIFGALPFWWNEGGYRKDGEETNKTGHNFYHYVRLQEEIARLQKVKFLNQFELPYLNPGTKDLYYLQDNLHMNYNGYANAGLYQIYFLATEKNLKPKK